MFSKGWTSFFSLAVNQRQPCCLSVTSLNRGNHHKVIWFVGKGTEFLIQTCLCFSFCLLLLPWLKRRLLQIYDPEITPSAFSFSSKTLWSGNQSPGHGNWKYGLVRSFWGQTDPHRVVSGVQIWWKKLNLEGGNTNKNSGLCQGEVFTVFTKLEHDWMFDVSKEMKTNRFRKAA